MSLLGRYAWLEYKKKEKALPNCALETLLANLLCAVCAHHMLGRGIFYLQRPATVNVSMLLMPPTPPPPCGFLLFPVLQGVSIPSFRGGGVCQSQAINVHLAGHGEAYLARLAPGGLASVVGGFRGGPRPD